MVITQYLSILQQYYYLDSNDILRYKHDGYLNRYKANDTVRYSVRGGYKLIIVPTVRNKANGSTSVRYAHIVWYFHGNTIPKGMELDHIDGNRLNNSITNLRLVNRTKNNKNRKKRSDNTSGITGICWNKAHNAWCIRRTVKGKRLATYRKDFEEAKKALAYFTSLDPDYTARHGK